MSSINLDDQNTLKLSQNSVFVPEGRIIKWCRHVQIFVLSSFHTDLVSHLHSASAEVWIMFGI